MTSRAVQSSSDKATYRERQIEAERHALVRRAHALRQERTRDPGCRETRAELRHVEELIVQHDQRHGTVKVAQASGFRRAETSQRDPERKRLCAEIKAAMSADDERRLAQARRALVDHDRRTGLGGFGRVRTWRAE
jgi:hypothetical protein